MLFKFHVNVCTHIPYLLLKVYKSEITTKIVIRSNNFSITKSKRKNL